MYIKYVLSFSVCCACKRDMFCFRQSPVIPDQQTHTSKSAKTKSQQRTNEQFLLKQLMFSLALINVLELKPKTAIEYRTTSNFKS